MDFNVLQKMIRCLIALIPLVTLFVSCASSVSVEPTKSQFKIVESSRLHRVYEGIVNGKSVHSSYKLRPFDARVDSKVTSWIGMDGGTPDFVFSSFAVTINGKTFSLPTEVYRDFGEPTAPGGSMSLSVLGQEVIISYFGSDGAGTYSVDFVFTESTFDRAEISPYFHRFSNLPPIIRKPKAEQGSAHQSTTAP